MNYVLNNFHYVSTHFIAWVFKISKTKHMMGFGSFNGIILADVMDHTPYTVEHQYFGTSTIPNTKKWK